MPLDNFITSIKLRLLSVQSNDIVDIYEHINVSDLKLGENKIRITNPQIIRLLKNSSRVYKVSIINEYMGMATISKMGEDYTTTRQYLLGYDSESSDADESSDSETSMDVDADASLIKELYTDVSSDSETSMDADADATLIKELYTDASSESGASEDTDASLIKELYTDGSSESETSMDSYYDSEISIDFLL